jgi:hypothetical protein
MNKKTLRTILLILIIPLIAEIFIFNFRFWESLTFKKVTGYSVTREANAVTVSGMDAPVKNVLIDRPDSDEVLHLQMILSDEANTDLELSVTEIVPSVEESKYIRIYPDGNVREIKILFDVTECPDASEVNVELNSARPFCIHVFRVLLIAVLVALVLLFRPGSHLYKMPLCGENKRISDRNKIYVLLGLASLICLWMLIVYAFNYDITAHYKAGHIEAIYTYQAESILNGHVWLDFTPPKYLSEMANPYDYNERLRLVKETGESFKLDFAFFNGKYYSYYGIVPTLLFYVPYVAMTGLHLNNSVPVLLMGVVFILFSFLLIYKLVRRYYPEISLGIYFLLVLVFTFGTGAFYCAQTPHVYSVAFISAVMFTVIALYNWISASDKHFEDSRLPLSKARLLTGAIAMGLAIGSRPVFGLYAFLAFPLFYSEIRDKLFFSKKGIANTICVIAPLLLIGSALLYFNKLRFGSFFDFGNTYNLSEMDLQNRHFGIRRLWLGFFEYLFQPLKIGGRFPYIESVFNYRSHSTDYMGYMFFDPVYGGYFALCPICLCVVLIRIFRKELASMKMYWTSVIALVFAAVLLVLDIEMTGITLRYQMDFGLPVVLTAVLILILLMRKAEDSSYKNAFKTALILLIVLTGITVFNNLLIMLGDNKQWALITTNPRMYYSVKYLLFALR